MKIKTESCWNGTDLYFRCTMPDGKRFVVRGDTWTRKQSTEALDYLECFYKINRRTVRFI